MRDPDAWKTTHKARFIRFHQWLAITPGLEELSKDLGAAFAIAQHYGLPTHFLDFTTDPAVAGFFAADGDPPAVNTRSCIFCLDTADLVDLWGTVSAVLAEQGEELAPIDLVLPDVANLWRLQSQSGTFLFVPTNWEVHYPMDRIEFPYTGYPSFPTKRDIYPDRKSQLEILLDQFFDNERKLTSNKQMREFVEDLAKTNSNVSVHRTTSYPLGYVPQYVASDRLEPHGSWAAIDDWLALSNEHHSTVWRRDAPIAVDFSLLPPDLARRFANGARRAMDRDPSLRKHSVTWRIDGTSLPTLRPSLADGLSALWDGLRSLPFTNVEVSQALGTWLALYALDYDLAKDRSEQKRIVAQLLGPPIRIEFGAADGSSSIGYASIADLRSALRPDLAAILADDYKSRIGDLEFLLQVVKSPRFLFNFRLLTTVFATQIAPSQMTRAAPFFFSPARLSILGLP